MEVKLHATDITRVPTPKEELEEKKYWETHKYYCPSCKKATMFARCGNCGKRFCLNHCDEETESYEEGGRTSPLCYHCT